MSSENAPQKINLILCDLPPGVTQSDIESFLSPYKSSIESIQIYENNPQKAKMFLEKALEYEELPLTLEHLADIYYAEGNDEKAYILWK